MPPDTLERATLPLKDAALLRTAVLRRRPLARRRRRRDHGRRQSRDRTRRSAPRRCSAPPRRARAIEAADRAWPAWRAKTAKERSAILRKWNDLMLAHVDDLALILTTEQGKPLAEAKGEVTIGAAYVEWFAEEAKRDLRRRDPDHRQRSPPRGDQGAGRRVRRDHAVEFPVLDDHAQGVAGARGGLHRRDQAGRGHPLFRVRAGRARAPRGLSARRAQRHHRRRAGDRRRAVRQSDRCASSRSPARRKSGAC